MYIMRLSAAVLVSYVSTAVNLSTLDGRGFTLLFVLSLSLASSFGCYGCV